MVRILQIHKYRVSRVKLANCSWLFETEIIFELSAIAKASEGAEVGEVSAGPSLDRR